MDFYIGPTNESHESWLEREGIRASSDHKINWESAVHKDFLPVVLIRQPRSSFAVIAHCKEKLDEFTADDEDRPKKIYMVSVGKLLEVAGKDFIQFAKETKLVDKATIEQAKNKEEENLAKLRDMLFSGQPGMLGGLSNEAALARACPKEFQDDNSWSHYAMQLFFSGGKINNWKFKSADPQEQRRQCACFKSLLGTFGLPHEDKEAVAGWMLSEMLETVPEYIAA